MIILDTAVNAKLQIVLNAAPATNQLSLYEAHVDIGPAVFAPGASNGVTNGTTAVTFVGSPGGGNTRQIKYLSIYNGDTADATVTLQIVDSDGLNPRKILKKLVKIGERIEFVDTAGFVFPVTVVSGGGGGSGVVETIVPGDGISVDATDPANPIVAVNLATTITDGDTTHAPTNDAVFDALAAKQSADSDLTAIAALTPTNDDLLQRKAGAWTNRTPAQVKTDLALTKADVGLSNVDNTADASKPVSTAQQAAIDALVLDSIADSDTTHAPSRNAVYDALALKVDTSAVGAASGVAPLDGSGKIATTYLPAAVLGQVEYQGTWDATSGSAPSGSPEKGWYYIVTVAGTTSVSGIASWDVGDWIIYDGTAWSKVDNTDSVVSVAGLGGAISGASLKTALSLVKADVGLGSVDNTSDADKPVSTAQAAAIAAKQDSDSDLTAIAGLSPTNDDVLQRKSGAWINRTPSQLKTDLALTKTDVGLGSADNTADASKNVATAATLTTSRNIDGVAFNGSADITVIAPATHAATSKGTPVDADELPLVDSAASNVLKKLTWANLKATLQTFFDARYRSFTPRVQSITSSSTPTADADANDALIVTALAVNAVMGAPTGTPVQEQKMMYRFKDDGTPRTLGWNAIFVNGGQALPTTTVAGKVTRVGTIYNATLSRWECVAVSQEP